MNQIPLYLANNFIEWGQRNGVEITPLKLQKLLYLYYARFCYTQNARPFEDCFEKWKRGPVVPSIYHATKHYGAHPLSPLYDTDGTIGRIRSTSEPFRTIFEDVVQKFGKKTAHQLVNLTHGDGVFDYQTAWEKAQDGQRLSTKDIQQDGEVLFRAMD